MLLPTELLSSSYIICESCGLVQPHLTFIDVKNLCLMHQCRTCGFCVSDQNARMYIPAKDYFNIKLFDVKGDF